MEARIALLHRRITLYRRCLQQGVSAAQASLYLKQIGHDEAELTAIANDGYHSDCRQNRPSVSVSAQRYRELAEEETDPENAALLRKLAVALENDCCLEQRI
jgi:hypothetical protein